MRILPGFEALCFISVVCDSFSVLLNFGLMWMLLGQPTTLDKKTICFAIIFCILSMIFAVFHTLIIPFSVIMDGIGMSFAGSFLHDSHVTQYLLSYGMSPTYMALLECGAFNFLYKYAATCNKSLHHRFDDNRFVAALSSSAIFTLLTYTYFAGSFVPSQALREKARDSFVALSLNDRFQTDFRNPDVAISGIDSDEQGGVQAEGLGPIIALLNFMVLVVGSLGTMMWCGWRIQHMIASNKLSDRKRKLHRQALRLLVLQTFNPLFFAVVPSLVPIFFVQSKATLPPVWSWFNAYGLLLFPMLNPIIFVICTKEFRNRVLARLIPGRVVPKAPVTSASFSLHFKTTEF